MGCSEDCCFGRFGKTSLEKRPLVEFLVGNSSCPTHPLIIILKIDSTANV